MTLQNATQKWGRGNRSPPQWKNISRNMEIKRPNRGLGLDKNLAPSNDTIPLFNGFVV